MGAKLHMAMFTALVMGVTFMNIPSALGVLMKLYSANFTVISLLMGALFWAHSLSQVPAGMLVDRLGLGRIICLSLALMAGGNLLAGLYPLAGWAVAGRILAGLGTGFSFPAMFKMFGVYAPPGRAGTYQAFFGGIFALGCIVAYLALPPLVEHSWRWAFLLPGLASLPPLAVALFLDFSQGAPQAAGSHNLKQIMRTPIAWGTGVFHALSWGTVLAVGSWLPSLLAEVAGQADAASFAWGGALLMLVSGLSRFAGGLVMVRLPAGLIVNGSLALNSVLFLALYFTGQPSAVLLLALGAIFLASINFGSLFQIATAAGPAGSMATFLGFVNLLANLGGLVSTFIFGWFKDNLGSFGAGFLPLALFCLLAVALGGRLISREAAKQAAARAS